VDQVGLVRWDINGFGDQNATLTWQDQSDDFWSSPIVALTGSSYDPKGTRGLAVSADGTIWSGGGSGVAHFSYDADVERATLIESFTEKTSGTGEGLLTGTVGDIELDANDDLWVAMESGLNRIRRREGTTAIDAYTDFVNYFAFSFGSIYSPSIIAPLPGGQPIWELAAEPHGHRLLVGADAGAALLRIAPRAEGGNALDGLYLYPNPYLDPVADMRGLKLGGFAASVTVSELMEQGGAEVVIFNLEGQEIFRDGHVANDQAFWDGTNYRGELVSTGLYVVQVSLSGSTVVKTLAVVR
jgi:hypothetical protein